MLYFVVAYSLPEIVLDIKKRSILYWIPMAVITSTSYSVSTLPHLSLSDVLGLL